jgi:predicted  nucleic acid-binding Zn-ribbon protein
VGEDLLNSEILCERLLREQPQSKKLLERLLAKSRRRGAESAFAPIRHHRCSACNMSVASARLQKAKAGEFINCAHCSIFLYHEQQ